MSCMERLTSKSKFDRFSGDSVGLAPLGINIPTGV
jgi:hypothetical protein